MPPFRRSTSAPTEMTQIIELPPGGFLPPPPPAPHAILPPPEKTDRKSVALALALGLLAGALVLLLLAGIVRSRQATQQVKPMSAVP